MTCKPYRPKLGEFKVHVFAVLKKYTDSSKEPDVPESGPPVKMGKLVSGDWSIDFTNNRFRILKSGKEIKPPVPSTYGFNSKTYQPVHSAATAIGWKWFGTNERFLVIWRNDGNSSRYYIYIFDKEINRGGETGPYNYTSLSGFSFYKSPDESAFMIIISKPGNSNDISVIHAARVAQSNTSITPFLGRQFNVTHFPLPKGPIAKFEKENNKYKLKVYVYLTQRSKSQHPIINQELPSGKLRVSPSSKTFPETVVGQTSKVQFSIHNAGNDCSKLKNIEANSDFTISQISLQKRNKGKEIVSFPVDLDPRDRLIIEVLFSPKEEKKYKADLPIESDPPTDEQKLMCRGRAKRAIAKLNIVPASHDFGLQEVNTSIQKNFQIYNIGNTDAIINIPASSKSSPFDWTSITNEVLKPKARKSIEVSFTPGDEISFAEPIAITSNAPDSPNQIEVKGEGCIPNAEIFVPPLPFPDFGEIQEGFRMVRFINIENRGDAPLKFTARIDGADKDSFGILGPQRSITDVESYIQYEILPKKTCGSGLLGSGVENIAVVFHAKEQGKNNLTAELIIENHNASNTNKLFWRFPLKASIIAAIPVDVALAIDHSGSMSSELGSRKKIDSAIDAGKLFTSLLRADMSDRLAIIKYSTRANVVQSITDITSSNHQKIIDSVNENNFIPEGATSIAAGLSFSIRELGKTRLKTPSQLTRAIIVLTDGKDNTAYKNPEDGEWYSLLGGKAYPDKQGTSPVRTKPIPIPQNIKVYAIGLGKEIDVDKGRLEQLSQATGGYFGVVGELSGDSYFNIEKYFTQIFMDVAGKSILKDPHFIINPGEEQIFEFDVLRGDIDISIFVYDEHMLRIPFFVETPLGERIDKNSVPSGFAVNISGSRTSRYFEIKMPSQKHERYAGRWKVIINHNHQACYGHFDNEENWDCVDEFDIPIHYGLAIGVASNFRMQPFVTPHIVHTGEPILLAAQVFEAGLPVTDCQVTVRAISPSGRITTHELLDDGRHNDGDANNGEFARLFLQTYEEGSYEFTFCAKGWSHDNESVNREAVLGKYVVGRFGLNDAIEQIGE